MGNKKRAGIDYVKAPKNSRININSETKRGIFIVVLFAIGAVCILSLINKAGVAGNYINSGLSLTMGWGKWLFPVLLIIFAYIYLRKERYELRISNYIGFVLFIISFQTFLFLITRQDKWGVAASSGGGGGYVGLIPATLIIKAVGLWAAFIVVIGLIIISLLLIFNTGLSNLMGSKSVFAKIFVPVNNLFIKIFGIFKRKDSSKEIIEEEESAEIDEPKKEDEKSKDKNSQNETVDEAEEDSGENYEEEKEVPNFKPSAIKNEEDIEDVWWEPTNLKIDLPLSLLSGKKNKPTSGDIKENKEIIRKTLENFNIPVEMGEISVGPTVTQYTFKPAEGIKLSRIATLSNDLALALAAHPIRIEAPIPGKRLVGVEVPNETKAIVNLREVLLSKNFGERKNNLMAALGKDVAGKTWLDDLSKMPHMLVAGATNSGKSVCLNAIIISLLYQNNPDDLRFIMVDPKRVELPIYNGIPYLLTPVITEVSKTVNALKWCLNEMDRRFDLLSKSHKRDIKSYNEMAKIKMPYIVFIIDELADLMMVAPKEIEAGVIRLAQMARAVGIHLILATQRPSVDIITGVIKANMPARAAFSVASGIDSRTILDSLGAEKLLGRGDMLFINPEMSKPVRLQGAYVSDLDIKKIVRFIKERSGDTCYLDSIVERQKVKGIGGVGLDGASDDDDELLEEAKETVINSRKASASFLQRKLSIGYARAARLLDILEENGIIGPGSGAKPREILISREQYDSQINQGVSGVSLHSRENSIKPEQYLQTGNEDLDEPIPPVFDKNEETINTGDLKKDIDNEDVGEAEQDDEEYVSEFGDAEEKPETQKISTAKEEPKKNIGFDKEKDKEGVTEKDKENNQKEDDEDSDWKYFSR